MSHELLVKDICSIARTWKDTPFQHQGRLKHIGVDCGGLLLEVFREAQVFPLIDLEEDFQFIQYPRYHQGLGIMTYLTKYFKLKLVPRRIAMQCADVVIFQSLDGSTAHAGLLVDGPHELHMIHAYSGLTRSRSRVQEHRFSVRLFPNVYGIYRLPFLG